MEKIKNLISRFLSGDLKACVQVRNGKHYYYVLNGNDDHSNFDYVVDDVNVIANVVVPSLHRLPEMGESVRVWV